MKVALCLSGQTRTYKDCFPSQYEQIISKYNCDVFIHTWMYNGLYPKTPNNLHYCKEYDINNYDSYLSQDYLIDSELFNLYRPKKTLIEFPDKQYFIDIAPDNNKKFFNALMMYYSIYQSNKLKSNYETLMNFKYDIVIRCRFDLFFQKVNLILNNTNTIYLPPNANFNQPFTSEMNEILNKIGPKYMTNDQFAYGASDAINYYCDVFNQYMLKQVRYIHHPEGMLSQHLWDFNTTHCLVAVNPDIIMGLYEYAL